MYRTIIVLENYIILQNHYGKKKKKVKWLYFFEQSTIFFKNDLQLLEGNLCYKRQVYCHFYIHYERVLKEQIII